MHKLKVLIPRDKIARKVVDLAKQIERDYRGKNLLIVGALKGSFVFMSDLVRAMNIPVEIDFVRVSSYGSCKKSAGKISLILELSSTVRGRDVIIAEDIVDSGCTLSFLLDYIKRRRPASLKVCALFDKPSRRVVDVPLDYVGFTIPDAFVVGYGLDFDEKYRHLPDLCVLEE